jgi:heme-degrading monooxygenase HmoA
MKDLPGFVSANIHKSFDGTKVVNYAQWRTRENFEAIKQDSEARPHMQAAAALGEFEAILCDVVDSFDGDG